jgi:hypothetical protein
LQKVFHLLPQNGRQPLFFFFLGRKTVVMSSRWVARVPNGQLTNQPGAASGIAGPIAAMGAIKLPRLSHRIHIFGFRAMSYGAMNDMGLMVIKEIHKLVTPFLPDAILSMIRLIRFLGKITNKIQGDG